MFDFLHVYIDVNQYFGSKPKMQKSLNSFYGQLDMCFCIIIFYTCDLHFASLKFFMWFISNQM